MAQTSNTPAQAGKAKKPFFYGWVIIGAGSVLATVVGFMFTGFSTYLTPLGKEFGWSRAQLAGPRSLNQAEGALLGPINGYLVDKFGARKTMSFGVIMLGFGLLFFAGIDSLWQYFAVNLLIGLGSSFAGTFPLYQTLNYWFRRKRTIAIAITQQGIGVAGLIAVPALVLAQTHLGWRTAAIISAIVIWVIGLSAASLLRRSPESMGQLPDGDQPGQKVEAPSGRTRPAIKIIDFTVKEALRSRAFWFLSSSNGLGGLVMQTILVHLFLHLEGGVGLSRGAAAGAFAFMNAVTIVGRFVGGYLGDRYNKRYIIFATLVCMAISVVPLALAHSMTPVLIFAALFGFAWGARIAVQISMLGDYFGRTNFGKIAGTQQAVAVPLAIFGPVGAGFLADRQGDYTMTLLILAGIGAIACVLCLMALPPKPPARVQAATPATP